MAIVRIGVRSTQLQNHSMQAASSIMLLVERHERVHLGFAKALALARHTDARLRLFLCDCEHYRGAEAREAGLRRGWEYLRGLGESVFCPDLELQSEVVWAPSLVQGVVDKLRGTPAQLIVYATGRTGAVTLALTGEFVGQSGTPVLLTRGRPWQPAPLFVAALTPGCGTAAATQIGELSELWRCRCGAQVDFLIANASTLPQVIEERDYDLIALALPAAGAREDRGSALRLLETTSADVLFVSPAPTVVAPSESVQWSRAPEIRSS